MGGGFHHRGERLRQIRALVEQAAARWGSPSTLGAANGGHLEGVFSRQQVKEQHAQGVDIAGDGGVPPGPQFRGHVSGSAPPVATFVASLREAKVHQHDATTHFAHGVAGFDVAMQEPGGVDGADGFG